MLVEMNGAIFQTTNALSVVTFLSTPWRVAWDHIHSHYFIHVEHKHTSNYLFLCTFDGLGNLFLPDSCMAYI